jgi:hypothetical protein
VAVSYGHEGPAGHTHPEDAAVAPLDAKPAAEAVALKPATVAAGAAGSADGRPKRQFGLGYLIGSALGGGYGYGRPYGGYGGYGGYGRPSGYGGYGGGYGGYGGGYGHGHRPYHGHG